MSTAATSGENDCKQHKAIWYKIKDAYGRSLQSKNSTHISEDFLLSYFKEKEHQTRWKQKPVYVQNNESFDLKRNI